MSKYHTAALLLANCAISACGWVDSTGAQARTVHSSATAITLTEQTETQVDFSDQIEADEDIAGWTLVKEGALSACANRIDLSDAAPSLARACSNAEQNCELIIIQQDGSDDEPSAQYTLSAPSLSAPVGLQYLWNETLDVTFCIDVVNDVPVAADDNYLVNQLETLTVANAVFSEDCSLEATENAPNILTNDSDDRHLGGMCLSAELIQGPQYAANDFTSGFNAQGGFIYTPDVEQLSDVDFAGENPTDTFTYRVYDGELYSAEATVTLVLATESTVPVANFDNYEVSQSSNNNHLTPLDNDDSPYDLPLKIIEIPSQPDSGGEITIRDDLSLLYTPADRFVGIEYFSYTIENSLGETASAYIGVRVAR